MKKIVAAALALTMVVGFTACNKGGETDVSTEAETTADETADETAASSDETSEETTEETAPALPEGYFPCELTDYYLGVKVSFAVLDDGRFAGNEVKKNGNVAKYGKSEFTLNYYKDSEWKNQDCVKYTVRIRPVTNDKVTEELGRYTAVEGANYQGYWHSEIEDKTKCYFEIYSGENTYLDGQIAVEIDMFAYQDFMEMDEYKTLVDNIIKSLKIEVLDENNLNDDEGNFPTASGLYTVPSKIKIDDKENDVYWSIRGGKAVSTFAFTNADGKTVTVVDAGQDVPKYVSARSDDPDRYRPVEFSGFSGICERATGKGNIQHTYTIVFATDEDGNETNMTFVVTLGDVNAYTSAELKEIFADETKTAEINALLDSYAEQYVSQLDLHLVKD